MANPKVLLSRGSSVTFPDLPKDPNTLYFLTDTKEIYLGGERYAIGKDINVNITGVGDTVSNVSWDIGTKTLTLTMDNAANAQSVKDAIASALESCIKSIKTDRGSSILVDETDPENIKLSLNLAQGEHAGNVKLEECSDGLRASIELPEDAVDGVGAHDKVLAVEDKKITSTLGINTIKENGVTYVVLTGIGGVEVSRFDASEFLKDGFLDSVSLEYASDGSNHRVIVFVFNTASGKETIKVDVQEFIDIYGAAQGGGLKEVDGKFSIANEVTASTGPINEDVAPAFGETIDLKAVKYDEHGLITGVGTFKFKMPSLVGGSAGADGKLLKSVALNADGTLSGETIDIATALSADATDNQIPTAKAVQAAIDEAKTTWERF